MTGRMLGSVALVAALVVPASTPVSAQTGCDSPASVPGVRDPDAVARFMTGAPGERGIRVGRVSYLNYNDIVPRLKTVSLAGSQRLEVRLARDGVAERTVRAEFVTGSSSVGRWNSPCASSRPGSSKSSVSRRTRDSTV
jgi:hypothetical protein